MNHILKQILDKKVIFVTGKGGTGKSTFSSAMSMFFAKQNKRVLLAEIDMTRPSIEDIFGKKLKDHPVLLEKNIDGINIEFEKSVFLYLSEMVSIEFIVKSILKNKVVKYFLEATPFSREIAILNAIYYFYKKFVLDEKKYDLIIVDLPATGHAFPILSIPQTIFRMFKIGPLLKRAEELNAFISSSEVSLLFITLAEELPINETIEVYNKIIKNIPIQIGPIIINKLPMEFFLNLENDKNINSKVENLKEIINNTKNDKIIKSIENFINIKDMNMRFKKQLDYLKFNVKSNLLYFPELSSDNKSGPSLKLSQYLNGQITC